MKLSPEEDKARKRYLAAKVKGAKRMLGLFYDKEDLETSIGDCIADMMHLATAEGWDYWRQHEKGLGHHGAEQLGGEHG